MTLASESIETVKATGDLTDSTLFKVLDGLSPVHGVSRYPGVGRWTKHLDPKQLHPCVYGYHLARGPQVLRWLGPTLYVAESCPDHPPVDDDDKLVTCRVRLVRRFDRWNDVTARLFAADCAEAALLGERASGREPDERIWAAVDAARRYARGEIQFAALSTAWEAAWDAAAAARVAARGTAAAAAAAAARAARATAAAGAKGAAGNAAEAAAEAAAAARAAAVRAAGAVWYTAEAAAEAAAAAAEAAAWDTAPAAALDAAPAAALDAAAWGAKVALYRRLCAYLEGAPIPPVEPLYGKETPGE